MIRVDGADVELSPGEQRIADLYREARGHGATPLDAILPAVEPLIVATIDTAFVEWLTDGHCWIADGHVHGGTTQTIPLPCRRCGWQYPLVILRRARERQLRLDLNPTHRCI